MCIICRFKICYKNRESRKGFSSGSRSSFSYHEKGGLRRRSLVDGPKKRQMTVIETMIAMFIRVTGFKVLFLSFSTEIQFMDSGYIIARGRYQHDKYLSEIHSPGFQILLYFIDSAVNQSRRIGEFGGNRIVIQQV